MSFCLHSKNMSFCHTLIRQLPFNLSLSLSAFSLICTHLSFLLTPFHFPFTFLFISSSVQVSLVFIIPIFLFGFYLKKEKKRFNFDFLGCYLKSLSIGFDFLFDIDGFGWLLLVCVNPVFCGFLFFMHDKFSFVIFSLSLFGSLSFGSKFRKKFRFLFLIS